MGPILQPAQFTFYTNACIAASLHPTWSWFSLAANSHHYTHAMERRVGEKQRRVPAQMIFGAILVIQKAIAPLTNVVQMH